MAEESGGVAAERLTSFIERLERLHDEKQEVADQITDVFAELKSEGFQIKPIRAVLKLRRMSPHDRSEQDELLAMYRGAVGV